MLSIITCSFQAPSDDHFSVDLFVYIYVYVYSICFFFVYVDIYIYIYVPPPPPHAARNGLDGRGVSDKRVRGFLDSCLSFSRALTTPLLNYP